jgi:biopolymer transport protein TolQ
MQTELSILSLIINADVVVQIVMALLIIASLVSWTLIFNKKSIVFKEKKLLKTFDKRFDIDKDLSSCFNHNGGDFVSKTLKGSEVELGYENGVEIAYRKINLQITQRVESLEKNLSTLASIASASPYIGLFGTVWGIMHSFLSLASVKQATIAIVAPGIAEALIATAFGLFAAIPANIFYNKLTTEVDEIHNKYQNIIQQFLVVMQREQKIQSANEVNA